MAPGSDDFVPAPKLTFPHGDTNKAFPSSDSFLKSEEKVDLRIQGDEATKYITYWIQIEEGRQGREDILERFKEARKDSETYQQVMKKIQFQMETVLGCHIADLARKNKFKRVSRGTVTQVIVPSRKRKSELCNSNETNLMEPTPAQLPRLPTRNDPLWMNHPKNRIPPRSRIHQSC